MDTRLHLQPTNELTIQRHEKFKEIIKDLEYEIPRFNFDPLKRIYYNTGKVTPKLAIAILKMCGQISCQEVPELNGLINIDGDYIDQVHKMGIDDKQLLFEHLTEEQQTFFTSTFG